MGENEHARRLISAKVARYAARYSRFSDLKDYQCCSASEPATAR